MGLIRPHSASYGVRLYPYLFFQHPQSWLPPAFSRRFRASIRVPPANPPYFLRSSNNQASAVGFAITCPTASTVSVFAVRGSNHSPV